MAQLKLTAPAVANVCCWEKTVLHIHRLKHVYGHLHTVFNSIEGRIVLSACSRNFGYRLQIDRQPMKKRILLAAALLIIICFAAIYLFIPNRVRISVDQGMPVNREGLMRNLGIKENWHKWWPGTANTSDGKLLLNGIAYEPQDIKILSIPFRGAGGGVAISAEMTALAVHPDSTLVSLQGVIPTSYNPIQRVQRYFTARRFRKDAALLLQSVSGYYSSKAALYNYDIRKDHVVDSTLLSNFREVKGYPSTEKIYSLVDELRAYIKTHGASETGYPMLNIFTEDSVNYLLKVAIPVDKKLPDAGSISYRWMLGGGNILITEVKGGNEEIRKAYWQIELYISDHKRVAPAIPFESLVTDRRQQPDSSRWITRIYYPVM